jgi:hypothetical protein
VSSGGPPPGRNFRQACSAARNCGESGSTFPIDTPKILIPSLAEPDEAGNPCDARHAANTAVLGLAAGEDWLALVVVAAVVARFATAGASWPPQPAASSGKPASAIKASIRPISHERGRDSTPTGKPTLVKLL